MPLSSLRILVVDDSEPLRYPRTILLRRAGAIVLEAETGRGALTVLETEPLDLAIVDVNLPDMSAIESSDAMQARTESASIPAICASASERPYRLPPSRRSFRNRSTRRNSSVRFSGWSGVEPPRRAVNCQRPTDSVARPSSRRIVLTSSLTLRVSPTDASPAGWDDYASEEVA